MITIKICGTDDNEWRFLKGEQEGATPVGAAPLLHAVFLIQLKPILLVDTFQFDLLTVVNGQ